MITAWKWDPAFLPKNGGAMYGWFFFLWMAIMLVEALILLPIAAKKNEKTRDRVVFTYGAVMLAAEVYKIVFFTRIEGGFPWHLFSWQFCSVPMYVAFIAPLLKPGVVKDSLYKFLAVFGLIAGIMTLILPEGFYWDYITITCHSFFWHTSIVLIGVYVILANDYMKRLKNFFKEWIPAALVLAIAILIALTLNVIWWAFVRPHVPSDAVFNMFYISPFFNSSLPFFRDIQPLLPYPVFLLTYLLAFSLGGAFVWMAGFGVRTLFGHARKNDPRPRHHFQ